MCTRRARKVSAAHHPFPGPANVGTQKIGSLCRGTVLCPKLLKEFGRYFLRSCTGLETYEGLRSRARMPNAPTLIQLCS